MAKRIVTTIAVAALLIGCRKEEPPPAQADPQARPIGSASVAPLATVPLELPKAAVGGEEGVRFVIVISASGTILVDGDVVTDDAKIEALARAAVAKEPEVRAIVSAAREANYGRVIDVIDRVKRGGISKISFAVTPKAP